MFLPHDNENWAWKTIAKNGLRLWVPKNQDDFPADCQLCAMSVDRDSFAPLFGVNLKRAVAICKTCAVGISVAVLAIEDGLEEEEGL